MTSKAKALVNWARVDGNDQSLTEITIGNDADAADRFDWNKMIDALQSNTHVNTVIVHVDNLSTFQLVSLGFRLVSSSFIKTLQLRDCNSPDYLLALLKFFTKVETLAVTDISFDNDSAGALNTQNVALMIKQVLSNSRHVRTFELIFGRSIELESFKTICQGVQASHVKELYLGLLSTERVEYCRSLIQDGSLETFTASFENGTALRCFGAYIRGNSTLQRLNVGFYNNVPTESIREFLEIDLLTMKKLRDFRVNLQGRTDRRTFVALHAAVSGLGTIEHHLLFYADRLNRNVFSALVPSFLHLSSLKIMMDEDSNMQVNQGDDSSVDMLYDAFANNSSLSRLALPLGIFPPGTFSGLIRAVPTMSSLESLCLHDEDNDDDMKVTDNQTKSILNMVKESKTLSRIQCVYDYEVPERAKMEIEFHSKLNKVRHEDFVKDAPLALWPHGLAQVQKPKYKPLSLDLFYFLLRQRCDVLVPPGNSHKKRKVDEIE